MFHNTSLNSLTCTSSYYRSSINNSCYSCSCCCCCCCSNNTYNNNDNYCNSTNLIYINRINPSFVCNGLRQSTLIQFTPSKRLSYYGKRVSLISDSDRKYYFDKLDSFKEKKKLGKGKGRFSCSGYGNDEYVDEVESLLDLLSEGVGVGVEKVSVRERKRIEKESGKKKNVRSGFVKRGNKGVEIRCTEEEEDRKKVVEKVNCERKKGGSSCSSYYSVSSTGDYDSDNEVEVEIKRDDGFVKGESSSEYKNDLKTKRYRSYDERVEENVDRRQEIGKEESEIVRKNTAEMYYGNEEWRKKSEKKLNVESSQHSERNSQQRSKRNDRIVDQTQSRMKYKTLLEKSETDDKFIESSSNSQKRYSVTDDKLITSEYKGESSNRITREDEYRRRSNAILEASRIHEIDNETRMKNWEDNSIEVSGQFEDRREEEHQRIDELTAIKESRVKSEQISDTNITSSFLETRMKKREDNSVKVSGQVDDRREENLQRINQLTTLNDSRLNSEEISEISDTRMTSSSFDTRMNSWEDNITEISGQVDDRREEKYQRIDQSTTLNESRVNLQRFSEISDTRITNTENTSVSRRQSDMIREKQDTVTMDQRSNLRRKDVEGTYSSSSGMEKVEGVTEAMKTGRRTTKASSFNVGMPREASSSYKALKLNPEPNLQKPGARGSGQTGSLPIATTSSAGEIHEQPQDNSRVQRSEISGGDIRSDSHQEPLSYISHEDAIVSAGQQQISSSHFVGEFVKKAKHELSISGVQHEKETHEEKSSGEDSAGNSDQKDGPSDDMWHETGESSRQPLETPDAIELTGNDELVKRNGRSLWNVIGDVVRLRWTSPRSETHTPKSSGGKMLSTQSTGSERWFSGHEPEDSNDEILKTGSTKSTKSQSRKEKGQREGLDSPLSSSLNTNQGSSSKTMSPSVIEESSFPVPAIRMRRSPAVKRTSGETDASTSGRIDQLVPKPSTQVPQTEASSSGIMVIVDQPVSASVTEMGLKDSKDGEIKQRKLARIDQVTRDRFDEWEEAYTVEADQRKNDEFFMREALLEAKKAADFWEVPVGAVLVQDGKVIARGYNLVEELRDSTAHAEMICIREASNNLRSWRLSGTTLYVTLEPCPMCAGAILQARVDTVVWGAPNKLLGADGSWIRLFPDGDGGSGSDKPPPPVHPFHPNMVVRRGVLSAECADVMQQFFQLRRKKKEKRTEDEPPTPPPSCLPITHHHNSKFFSKMHDAFSLMFCL